MSEIAGVPAMNEAQVSQAIAAAVAEGVRSEPEFAAAKVIDSLRTALGPIVQKIVALIESGVDNLPAILDALKAAGVALPPWINVVAAVLVAVMKQQ